MKGILGTLHAGFTINFAVRSESFIITGVLAVLLCEGEGRVTRPLTLTNSYYFYAIITLDFNL